LRLQASPSAKWEGAQLLHDSLDNVAKKRKLDPTLSKLDELIELLESWEQEDAATSRGDGDRATSLSALRDALDAHDARTVLQSHHKDQATAATKLSKLTDKVIGTSVEGVVPPGVTLDTVLVNRAIHQHLLISGRFAVAELFASACGLDVPESVEAALKGMYAVRDALEAGETAPLTEWLGQHRGRLPTQRATALTFDLCQLRFVRLLKAGDSVGALRLLRQRAEADSAAQVAAAGTSALAAGNPTPVIPSESRLRQLAGALAFAPRLDYSPYADALDEGKLRKDLAAAFTRESLALNQLPTTSPLVTCVEVCSLALPRLAKLASMIKGKYIDLCRSGSTLPLDLDFGPSFAFHSNFTCPISKESASRDNPPMLLPCGHVLSLSSVTKLARERATGSRSSRFKCPYCPAECTIVAAQSLTI
jgi:hypothetical protein